MSGTIPASLKTPEDEDSRLGQVVDSYRLVRRIATGGMGTVYEAVHVHLGRRYAMKVLNPQLQGNAQATARFIAEGQAANQPTGQGVVAVHDVRRTENGAIYILMEYLEGETLSARIAAVFGGREQGADDLTLRRPPPPPDREYLLRALRLAKQMAVTLEAIHHSGVIHRDLKPDNVFVIQDPDAIGGERVKILDFGIAKLVAPPSRRQTSPVTWAPTLQRTELGTVLGTPTYMAPEQWRGDGPADARTDSYGLGAILFEMFAGRPPFTAKLIGDLMAQHCRAPTPRLDQVAPWVPDGLSELVSQMLAKDLRARPPMPVISQRLSEISAAFLGEPRPQRRPTRKAELWRRVAGLRQRIAALAGRQPGSANQDSLSLALARRTARTRMTAAIITLLSCMIALFVWRWLAPPPKEPGNTEPDKGDARAVRIDSAISGTQVYWLDGKQEDESLQWLLKPYCRTPCTLQPDTVRDTDFVILVRPGYRSRKVMLNTLRQARATRIELERLPQQQQPPRRGNSHTNNAGLPPRKNVAQLRDRVSPP